MPDWPLISDLGPLGALPTAPRLARGFATVVLNGWGLDDQVDVMELLVSELATNVVRASTASDGHPRYDDGKLPLLWVRLLSDRSRLMVEVWDNLPQALGAPVVRHPEPDEESGRGLEMVSALSEDWGWESVPGWHGKRVWALLGRGFIALAGVAGSAPGCPPRPAALRCPKFHHISRSRPAVYCMITKTYFSTKVLCEYTMKNLRQEKSLRDHEPI